MKDILLYFAWKYFGDWKRIYDALEKQEDIDNDKIQKLKREYKDMYLTILDKEYPQDLKFIDKPPFVLFFKGNINLLNKQNKIWYYGSYYNDAVGKLFKSHKRNLLKNNITLVIGYSNNFEKSIISDVDIKDMIIVKDSGINSYINMSKVEEEIFMQNNLILSEYPDKVIPSLNTWEESNRMKIGLSKGIFLISSLKEKTTFKIIADTIDERKEVFCYNKNVDIRSHNSILILKGATPISKLEEMIK